MNLEAVEHSEEPEEAIDASGAQEIKPPGQRLALLICNSTYRDGHELRGVAQDAKALGADLSNPQSCRFTVRTLLDRGLLEVRREVARICAQSSEEDTLLIYYSGKATRGEDGSLYLIVADTELDYLYATSLDANFILEQLRRSTCRKIILLIDTCHAGSFFENNRGIPNGLYAITSCGADETTADTPEGGAFTLALCAGLRSPSADSDGDGLVSIDDLHEFAKRRLRAAYGRFGTPQKWVWNVPEPIYMTTVPRHVFLSYAREDVAEAQKLAGALEREGLPVWIDLEGILSGNWKERVTKSLNNTRAIVLLLTPSALESNAVRRELSYAAKKNVPILPVQLRQMEGLLPDWYILDYDELHRRLLDPECYDEGVRALAAAIRSLRKNEGPPTTKPTTGEDSGTR